jgi:hypothetical protein
MRKRVYIAGPLHNDGQTTNVAQNVWKAKKAFAQLLQLGYAPFCPHLTHYIDPAGLVPHDVWMLVDLPWVEVSHAVLRLPGPSKGADIEVNFARELGIPVFDHIMELHNALVS